VTSRFELPEKERLTVLIPDSASSLPEELYSDRQLHANRAPLSNIMPFRAIQEGEIVVPAMVENQEPVSCPECRETLYARGGEKRARHFYHVDESASQGCSTVSTGESSTHARCVALAVAALQEAYSSLDITCAAEDEIDVSESGSENKVRRADAVVKFEIENEVFGNGLVVEVQHRHHEKDIQKTTHDYLSVGYSVVWLSSTDFGEEQLNYSIVDEAFDADDGSGYCVRDYSPRSFLKCESYSHSGEHNWSTVPGYILTCESDYEICTSRPCTLRRKYDNEADEYIYNPDSITKPDLPLKVLKNTLVGDFQRGIKEPLKERYRNAILEKALADRPEIDQCPGPKGFHEWGQPESQWDGYARVELRPCQHCSVHLLTDLRGRTEARKDVFFSKHPDPDWDLLSIKSDPRQCDTEGHRAYDPCPDCGVSNPK